MTDIVERLRKREMLAVIGRDRPDIYKEAADEIERLRLELDMTQATIRVPSQKDDVRTIERLREELVSALDEAARLREALKPFAYYAAQIPNDVSNTASASGTVGDLRAAKAALENK